MAIDLFGISKRSRRSLKHLGIELRLGARPGTVRLEWGEDGYEVIPASRVPAFIQGVNFAIAAMHMTRNEAIPMIKRQEPIT